MLYSIYLLQLFLIMNINHPFKIQKCNATSFLKYTRCTSPPAYSSTMMTTTKSSWKSLLPRSPTSNTNTMASRIMPMPAERTGNGTNGC